MAATAVTPGLHQAGALRRAAGRPGLPSAAAVGLVRGKVFVGAHDDMAGAAQSRAQAAFAQDA
jgi:hypothetical protein